ncbi:MAG TPA: GFA family protein [Solirubrobacteraceae bacterium]|nr:GFA family protein [Solirubrobacteraceae bacterium]
MTDSPVLTGGCGCGAVRFTLSEPPISALYCHCGRCQSRTGTAAQASARVAPGSVTVTHGAEHLRDWTLETGLAKSFCELCGSHLFARAGDTGEVAAVRMSAFDGDPGVRPSTRQFVAYAASWEPIPDDGLPRYPERAPAD